MTRGPLRRALVGRSRILCCARIRNVYRLHSRARSSSWRVWWGWRGRRQRREGIKLGAASEERPQPVLQEHPSPTPAVDRLLDRAHLPPERPPSQARRIEALRIQDQTQPHRSHRGLNKTWRQELASVSPGRRPQGRRAAFTSRPPCGHFWGQTSMATLQSIRYRA